MAISNFFSLSLENDNLIIMEAVCTIKKFMTGHSSNQVIFLTNVQIPLFFKYLYMKNAKYIYVFYKKNIDVYNKKKMC